MEQIQISLLHLYITCPYGFVTMLHLSSCMQLFYCYMNCKLNMYPLYIIYIYIHRIFSMALPTKKCYIRATDLNSLSQTHQHIAFPYRYFVTNLDKLNGLHLSSREEWAINTHINGLQPINSNACHYKISWVNSKWKWINLRCNSYFAICKW